MPRRVLLVLIVDDSPEDREVVRRYLRKDREIEYRFVERSSGNEGLALCRSSEVDCLLLDYALPDLDGVDFLSRLTEPPDPALPPVIMLSGRGNESVAVQALKRGAQDYLVKGSFTSEFLRKTVDDAIERATIRRELERQRRELERLYDEARDADRLRHPRDDPGRAEPEFEAPDRLTRRPEAPTGRREPLATGPGLEWRRTRRSGCRR